MITIETLWVGRDGLVEAPRWTTGGTLIFSDARGGGVFSLDTRQPGEPAAVWAHRKGIGGIALHADGGLLVSGRNIAYRAPGEETIQVVASDEQRGWRGFNDVTVDASGRVWAGYLGSLALDAPLDPSKRIAGGILRIDLDGSVHQVAHGIHLTNGLAFSADGTRLFASDSARRLLLCYDVDTKTGALGPEHVLLRFERGAPDGMAVDAAGRIWLALAYQGEIVVCEPDGTVSNRLKLPFDLVTSICFGDEDLRTLYIVQGAPALGDLCGVHRLRTDATGLAVPVGRIAVPGRPPVVQPLDAPALFAVIDRMDAGEFAGLMATDGALVLRDSPVLRGRADIRARIDDIYAGLRGIHHEVLGTRTDGLWTVVELDVRYDHRDGPATTARSVASYRWGADGIAEYRVADATGRQ